ncbi:MAG: zinc metalloprotease HtpX [Thermodesulfovibrionales bacterium]|nr:zinc metalloprotease HtpX [Thermodesulfovibrionales bacterium]
MPITFIDIEKQKTAKITLLFLFLLCMYVLVTIALFQGALFFIPFFFLKQEFLFFWSNPLYLLFIVGFSLALASMHFFFATRGAVNSVMKSAGAVPPDPEDGIHKRLMNILDEIQVVTGDTRRIQCLVIPSLSMNAVAAADIEGDAAIAITEGLLSRLTRPQLEAVLAHEAYHILSNDCIEATVATSLFGAYAAMLDQMARMGEDEERGSGGIHPAFFLFWILVKLSHMLAMFISREREYRADAASVRMTKNPVALAEALHSISRNWSGSGFIGSGLEMLCFADPQGSEFDESSGYWENLMSTHPPIRKRIKVLLRMAHLPLAALSERRKHETVPVSGIPSPPPVYYALSPEQHWKGPFMLPELAALPWLSPGSWISRGNEHEIERASENIAVNALFTDRTGKGVGSSERFSCPHCNQKLYGISYERAKLYECRFCRGVLVQSTKIPRIIVRREKDCTERIAVLAQAVMADNQKKLTMKKLQKITEKALNLVPCPECRNLMMRRFYSLAYLIEIDRCTYCDLTWFDKDELEMLQCVIEYKMTTKME